MKTQDILQRHSAPYRVLGLSTTERPPLFCKEFTSRIQTVDPQKVLKNAFHQVSLETHPDKGGNAQHFKQVVRAFEYLNSKWWEHDRFYSGLFSRAEETANSESESNCAGQQSGGTSSARGLAHEAPQTHQHVDTIFRFLDDLCEELGF